MFKRKIRNPHYQLVAEATAFLLTLVIISTLWPSHLISNLVSFALVVTAFYFFHTREDIIFFTVAALLGTLGEIIVIKFGAWQYTHPFIAGVPLWLLILWGFSLIMVRRARDVVFQLKHRAIHYYRHPSFAKFKSALIFDFSVYILTVFLVATLWPNNTALFLSLITLLFIQIFRTYHKDDYFFIAAAAIFGPFAEFIGTQAGAWTYANPSLLGLPIWLPLLYASFIFGTRNLTATITTYLYGREDR